MKTTILAGIMLAAVVTASHADQYEFRHYISGLQPSSAPGDQTDPSENWSLPSATLPKAITGEAYSFSFQDLITPGGLEGFSWAGQGIPSWASLNAGTGELTGTPSASDSGEKSFAITASREGTDGQQVYTIEVGGITFEVVQIAAGASFTCAVTTDGGAMCWGRNLNGTLGNSSTTDSLSPVTVSGLSNGVASISAGTYHACAITTAGAAKCWGRNDRGQLGNNSKTDSSIPVAVTGLTGGVASIASGINHTCAITTAGAAKCWGSNDRGQLGNNSKTDRTTPVAVTGLSSGVTGISLGAFHTCAIASGGATKCWGRNDSGQLGNNQKADSATPVAVTGLGAGVKRISLGYYHSCAITAVDGAKCWGSNTYGQLGNNSKIDRVTPVTAVGLSGGVADITGGVHYTCAATTSGAAVCWGRNTYGQLGTGYNTDSTEPVGVKSLGNGVASIESGTSSACAITTTGSAKCWGYNAYGQLGNNSRANSPTPVDILPPAQ